MANFTPAQITAIADAPMMVGLVVAMAEVGIVSSAIEAAALTKEMVGSSKKYPNNSIVQAAFSEAAIRGGSINQKRPDIKAEDLKSGVLVDKTIATVNAAITNLGDTATADEVREYKEFIYACAEAVAKAAGSGLFGSGDPKISDSEANVLAKLKAALAV
jgi:hypothetical protein